VRILLINHYAGSVHHGMEYRPYYLACEWKKMGHATTIVASAVSHVRMAAPKVSRIVSSENIDGIAYKWLKTPAYSGNGIRRALNMFAFVSLLEVKSSQFAECVKPDLVIASSTYPMDIWPAHRIAKMAKAKLVFEVHDLWPLSPLELGNMSKQHPFIMLVQAAEDYAYCHADVVVSMLPKVREYMESRGMAPHKLHIIPNGIDPVEWQTDSPDLQGTAKEVLSALKAKRLSIIGYAGGHGLANSLDTLIDSAKLMKGEEVAFVLVGDGPAKASLQQRVVTEELHNVRFIDPVRKDQVPALLQWFDMAYIGWRRQPLYRFGIAPNKLMDYMMAGRPILHAVEAGNDPVSESGCGISIPPEDPGAVVRAVKQIMIMSPEDRAVMGQCGRDYVMANHDYRVLAKRFMDCLQ
jgi:glycosyltransferase involved in cell wall biosynthesis